MKGNGTEHEILRQARRFKDSERYCTFDMMFLSFWLLSPAYVQVFNDMTSMFESIILRDA